MKHDWNLMAFILFVLYFALSPFICECFMPTDRKDPAMGRWLGWVMLCFPPVFVFGFEFI